MKRFAIIVAGGKGERMGNEIPKQFIPINGIPVLMHTLRTFYTFDPSINIILVLPSSQIATWQNLCSAHNFNILHTTTEGGATRFDSVKKGLALINSEAIIAIHDGVRPLVSKQTLLNCFSTAETSGSAIPVTPVVETLRKISGIESKTVDRSQYRIVQTPQIFHYQIITKAYQQDFDPTFTDDASVVESLGIKVNLVEGNSENIKITTPPDLRIASFLLSEKN